MNLFPFKYSFASSLMLVFLVHSTMAASYIKPDESKELFKLEKIPLQVDSMKELARHLVLIAKREQENSAVQLRATGQLLALAMRLDPANQDAQQINDILIKGDSPVASPPSLLNSSMARVRFYKRWLSNPEAGAEANKLARYLTDATRVLHRDTINEPDSANWKGVLPPLEKYTSSKKLPPPPSADDKPENAEDNEDVDSPPETSPQFHITKLSVNAAYELKNSEKYRDPKTQETKYRTLTTQEISTVTLQLKPCAPNEKKRLIISTITRVKKYSDPSHDPLFTGIRDTLSSYLKAKDSPLPDYQSIVTISGGQYSRANQLALTAPIALLLESSLKNRPLRSDILLCAVMDKEGKLSKPTNFWLLLESLLSSEKGGRLIVPTDTAKLLNQMLVYGKPDFFTRWEVIAVSDIHEALAVAAKKSDSDLAKASRLFDSIRSLARKTAVTKLAVNRAVRSRLAKILQLAPNHLSAKILLLQGSGKRPMRFNETALAHNLLPVVKTMHHALNGDVNVDKLSTPSLKKTHEEAREKLDKIARLVDRSSDDLYQDTLRLANDFRRLVAIAKRAEGKGSSESLKKKVRTLFYSMRKNADELLSGTLVSAGYPAPEKEKP